MAGLAVTPGSGAFIAMDKVGSSTTPTTDDRLQYIKVDGGGGGLSAPIENGTAANLAAQVSTKALLTIHPGMWGEVHTPAANTQATKSHTAGAAGVRHVCTYLTATLCAGTTAPSAAQVKCRLRDGATGAGTILWDATMTIQATAGVMNTITLGGLNIVGTAATAMTLEFDGAAGANTFESVSFGGYSTPNA